MKILSLLLILIATLSCSHFNNRRPSNASTKPVHLIITVHGLSGNKDTFGYFNEATKKYIEEMKPNYEVKVVNFIYPSGQSEGNSAADFALGPQGLGSFIKAQFSGQLPAASDKISLVGHSQGGLVSYMWYFNSLLDRNQDFEYAKQVDSIITLGTPFWGSKIASILTDKNYPDFITLIKALAPENFKMTRREIEDLAYGSDTVDLFRRVAVIMDNDPALAQEIANLPVRLVTITGVLPKEQQDLFSNSSKSGSMVSGVTKKIINYVYKVFVKSYSGNKRVESDIAVPVSSSRWNFIYTTPKVITKDTEISSADFRGFNHLVDRSKFIFSESVHFPFDMENTLSMGYVSKSCLQVETCDHPTYAYVVDQLANCENNNPECSPEGVKNILEKINAKNPKRYDEFLSKNEQIKDSLESFALQINIKLKPGQIDRFPLKHFKRKLPPGNEAADMDIWDFDGYSLMGKVIDLKINKKTQESNASTANYRLILGDRDEKRSVDIVSRNATAKDPVDHLRINITGRVDLPANIKATAKSEGKQPKDTQYIVPVEINLPGLPSVKINAVVQPSYSTFTELDYTK